MNRLYCKCCFHISNLSKKHFTSNIITFYYNLCIFIPKKNNCMTFIAAAAAGSLILGGVKAISGANQTAKANRLAKQNVFTPEQMPYEVGLGTDLAARNYTNGMPGYGNAVNNINRNAASQFYRGSQGASSGGDLLDLATRIGQGSNAATNALNAQQADYHTNALGGYEAALANQANWQGKLYNNNVLQPYLRTANLAASMYGSGQQNMYSGLDDIASTGVGLATAYGGKSNNLNAGQRYDPITSTPIQPPPVQYVPFGQQPVTNYQING
jgi:hypothetical protein